MAAALYTAMATARRLEDLVSWQLAEALKEEVFRLTQRDRVARDKRFCEQIQESARSAAANIAEGFGRYDPKPNAYHVSIAKGSLEETRNHVYDGFRRNHFDIVERDELLQLTNRALIATTRYLRYLKSCRQAPSGNPWEPRTRARSTPAAESKPGTGASGRSLKRTGARVAKRRRPRSLERRSKNRAMKNRRPQNPGTRTPEPERRAQEPDPRNQNPEPQEPEPANQNPEPANQNPGTRNQNPGTRTLEPGTRTQEPREPLEPGNPRKDLPIQGASPPDPRPTVSRAPGTGRLRRHR
jgi:four helix bundle protein